MSRYDVPYREIDENMRSLVRILNLYPFVETIGSCGGHAEKTNASQWDAGDFYVTLNFKSSPTARYTIEFLAWAINHDYRQGNDVTFLPKSAPPYLNTPGECMYWAIEGYQADPEDLAQFLSKVYSLIPLEAQIQA